MQGSGGFDLEYWSVRPFHENKIELCFKIGIRLELSPGSFNGIDFEPCNFLLFAFSERKNLYFIWTADMDLR